MPLFLLSLSVAALLTLWFRTEVLIEYARLVGLARGFERWREARRAEHRRQLADAQAAGRKTCAVRPPDLRWLSYLGRHEGFLTRLLTCPFCLGIWFAAGVCLLADLPQLILPAYFLALLAFDAHTRLLAPVR